MGVTSAEILCAALRSDPQSWVCDMNELFVVCRTTEIDEEQARGFWLAVRTETGEVKPWPILITRKGNRFFGFENVCPHAGSRLDTVPGQFMDEDGNFLTCGQHHAQFDIDSGHCFIGPCQGKQLTAVPLIVDDGDVCVTGVELAEEDGLDLDA
jgi:nitrite reductase/ring-hydroxylating ferredoxin subunit